MYIVRSTPFYILLIESPCNEAQIFIPFTYIPCTIKCHYYPSFACHSFLFNIRPAGTSKILVGKRICGGHYTPINPVWHDVGKQEKCSFLEPPRDNFCKTLSWAGCQNNPINVTFHLQKSLEIFEKNSADKI